MIDKQDCWGRTVLIRAARENDVTRVLELLKEGANPWIRDINGGSAYDYMVGNRMKDCTLICEQNSEAIVLPPLPPEFNDVVEIMRNGAAKHGEGTWLDKDNPSLQHKPNCASMFRHLADHHAGVEQDHESGLDPLLHLACRALMRYTRKKRGKP